jgi:hypothetical protein
MEMNKDQLKIEIVNYDPTYDTELITLSYKSLFYKKKEFEYVRVPQVWIQRYNLSEDSIKKIAIRNGKIIASLGVLIRKGVVGGKKMKIGCLVDNCLDPEYLESYEFIFGKLLEAIESEARRKDVGVLQGWDFEKNIVQHKLFLSDRGYSYVSGVNWFPGGSDPLEPFPSLIWKILSKLYYGYIRARVMLLKSLPKGIEIRKMLPEDYSRVGNFLSSSAGKYEFGTCYQNGDFEEIVERNNIHGFVAQKNEKIVGVLTYIISAWSGWLYNKPFYDNDYKICLSFTPDEFHILPEYQDTSLGSRMLLEFMKTKDPHTSEKMRNGYQSYADVFHRRIEWRKRALKSLGNSEPAFDYGSIFFKPLEEISISDDKPWLLPSRYILSPVLQKDFEDNV